MDLADPVCWDICAQEQLEEDLLYKRTRELNAALLVSRLPPELLSEIFIDVRNNWTQDSFDWVRLTHVCHWWRHVALGTPRLWSNIKVSPFVEDNVERTKVFLERSKASPLTVDIRAPALDTTRAIFQEGHRIQNLDLDTLYVTYKDFAFPDTASVLQSLSLHAADREVDLLDVPRPFDTCQYPTLTNLYLGYYRIDPSSTLWAGTLTKLDLRECCISSGELLLILEQTPLLQYLKLTGEVNPSGSEPTPHMSGFVELLQLKSLSLFVTGDISAPTQILDCIWVPASCHLDIAMSGVPSVSVHEARAFWGSRVFSEFWVGTMKGFRSCLIYSRWSEVTLAFGHALDERVEFRDTRFQVTIPSRMTKPMDFFQEFFLRYSVANVGSLSVDNSRNWYRHGHPAYWGLVLNVLPNLKILELIEEPGGTTPVMKDVLSCLNPSKGKRIKLILPEGDLSATYLEELMLEGRLPFERGDRGWETKGEMKVLVEFLSD